MSVLSMASSVVSYPSCNEFELCLMSNLVNCNPLTIIGISGTSCNSQPLCCSDNSFVSSLAQWFFIFFTVDDKWQLTGRHRRPWMHCHQPLNSPYPWTIKYPAWSFVVLWLINYTPLLWFSQVWLNMWGSNAQVFLRPPLYWCSNCRDSQLYKIWVIKTTSGNYFGRLSASYRNTDSGKKECWSRQIGDKRRFFTQK